MTGENEVFDQCILIQPSDVGSIPTAPTSPPFSQQQLSDLSRRQKAAIRASRVAPMARMNEFQRCRTKVVRWTAHQRIASFPRTPFRSREGHMYDLSSTDHSLSYSFLPACTP